MKQKPYCTHPHQRAMTLIELLVVISIIGVLAGLILPAVGNVRSKARVVQAQKDMADMKSAISVYQHDYSRLPASTSAINAIPGSDFTYGTVSVTAAGVAGAGTGYGTNVANNAGAGYQQSNAELMVILTAGETNGWSMQIDPSIQNNLRNPRKTGYFNAKSSGASGATAGKGLGTDGVMRDPWGNPYIVALDLNYDNTVSNSVYRLQGVSQVAGGSSRGHFGLVGTGNGNNNNYTVRDTVMIFSFGPDGSFDTGTKANTGVNKDNVLSWK